MKCINAPASQKVNKHYFYKWQHCGVALRN